MQPDPHTWRPQAFGRRRPRDLRDPLVEPAWDGIRVLAVVDGTGARLLDTEGVDLAADHPEIVAELRAGCLAAMVVVDGYLTDQAVRSGVGIVLDVEESAGLGDHLTQFFVGKAAADHLTGRGRVPGPATTRAVDRAEEPEGTEPTVIAFVAIDLLAVDDVLLLDVPLLERKRILEGALAEANLVRRTQFVREPAGSFIATWRSLGFGGLAYKEANSRYLPGARNEAWSHVPMPRR